MRENNLTRRKVSGLLWDKADLVVIMVVAHLVVWAVPEAVDSEAAWAPLMVVSVVVCRAVLVAVCLQVANLSKQATTTTSSN